jgi:hypothetical protein
MDSVLFSGGRTTLQRNSLGTGRWYATTLHGGIVNETRNRREG